MEPTGEAAVMLELLAKLARAARPGEEGELLASFLVAYFAEVPADDLLVRTPQDLLGAALAHWDLGRRRAPGAVAVRIVSPGEHGEGWRSPHSVLLIVCDDAPFLVDTARLALERNELEVHLLVHPMLRVKRDGDEYVGVVPRGGVLEAWTQVEIDLRTPQQAAALEAEVRAALEDVQLAVHDFEPMRQRALELAHGLDAPPAGVPGHITEAVASLLTWLVRKHFVFLGAATYDYTPAGGLAVVDGSRLGLLRRPGEPGPMSAPTERLLAISRSDRASSVHRDARLTCIELRHFDADGHVTGLDWFVGMFSAAAYRASALSVPVVRERAEAVLTRSGFKPDTHTGRAMRHVLESLPRDALFELSRIDLSALVDQIVALQDRPLVRVIPVPEPVGPWLTALVYLPRARFGPHVPETVTAEIAEAYGATRATSTSTVGGSTLARIDVMLRRGEGVPDPDLDELCGRIDALTEPWDEMMRDALVARLGDVSARGLSDELAACVPDAFRAEIDAVTAVDDLLMARELALDPETLATRLVPSPSGTTDEWRFRIYRDGTPTTLSATLPLLEHLGLHVVDERPYELDLPADTVWMYDVGVRLPAGVELTEQSSAELQATFKALDRNEVESDSFNRLVLTAGLSGRQVAVLRAYAKYLRQIGLAFTEPTIAAALVAHPRVARGLVALFEARFALQPSGGDRDASVGAARAELVAALDDVPSLDDDRVGRVLMAVIDATTRTNAFQKAADGAGHRPVLAFKLDPREVPDLPLPRPRYEIWVASPRVEGVHLRGGPVARGGLRWSDRRDDFRTEVLGLMKAQMVKNAVIVPVGAKGGFVVKQPPADPAARRAEVATCYRMFVEGLLDVTDNLVAGAVVAPPDTVRYDGDDPYLVVAADKGTATFSDLANSIAIERGFWLGDAFASGGSVGYDHKEMGITARGAWESVRRHARYLGKDADRDPLTVAGIGDMSGDVFGNGMLCSDKLLLVAAFDHRHVFLDPSPDPAASFAERRRLFALAGSSWADYDPTLISTGGGVHPRTAKSIPVSAEARSRLGIEAEQLTPNELISAILRAPVDLLWNGGIGTYVKAAAERHADAGDRSNDAVRVDAEELRCKMVGEGGNLGFTQRGRIAYALAGGAINTDAIDNSAGVDCSDHEVNIKILLDSAVGSGAVGSDERNTLLASMTDEVAELVLANNKAQTLALQIARRQSGAMAHVHARYLNLLEAEGWVDRALEALPTDKVMAERQAAGIGLTTPEFAVLLAHTKIANVVEVLQSDLVDDPYLVRTLAEYFPTPMRDRFAGLLGSHPLRREIVAMKVVNELVNMAGTSFDHRLTEDTGAGVADICRAWIAARDLIGARQIWAEIDALTALDDVTPVKLDVQLELFLECRRMVERTTVWLLRRRRPPLDIAAVVAELAPGLREVEVTLQNALRGPLADAAHSLEASRLVAGVPESLAQRSSVWGLAHTGLDIVEVAAEAGHPASEVAAVYWQLFGELGITWLWEGIGALPRLDRWQTQARAALRDDLLSAHADLTLDVIAAGSVEHWLAVHARSVSRARSIGAEPARSGRADLTTLSVGLRQLRNLVLTSRRTPDAAPSG